MSNNIAFEITSANVANVIKRIRPNLPQEQIDGFAEVIFSELDLSEIEEGALEVSTDVIVQTDWALEQIEKELYSHKYFVNIPEGVSALKLRAIRAAMGELFSELMEPFDEAYFVMKATIADDEALPYLDREWNQLCEEYENSDIMFVEDKVEQLIESFMLAFEEEERAKPKLLIIKLHNGDRALYLNFVQVVAYISGEIGDVEDLASCIAKGLGNASIQTVEMDMPLDKDWNWDDILELLPADIDVVLPTFEVAEDRMLQVYAPDVLGQHDDFSDVPGWQWIEANASFKHTDVNVADLIVHVESRHHEQGELSDDVPNELRDIFHRANSEGIKWLLFNLGQ